MSMDKFGSFFVSMAVIRAMDLVAPPTPTWAGVACCFVIGAVLTLAAEVRR